MEGGSGGGKWKVVPPLHCKRAAKMPRLAEDSARRNGHDSPFLVRESRADSLFILGRVDGVGEFPLMRSPQHAGNKPASPSGRVGGSGQCAPGPQDPQDHHADVFPETQFSEAPAAAAQM